MLDEAANIAPLADLDALASTAAGHGVQLVTVWHDLAQINARYGPRAATVVNNHRAKLFLSGISDPSTLDYASHLIGEEEVLLPATTAGGRGPAPPTHPPCGGWPHPTRCAGHRRAKGSWSTESFRRPASSCELVHRPRSPGPGRDADRPTCRRPALCRPGWASAPGGSGTSGTGGESAWGGRTPVAGTRVESPSEGVLGTIEGRDHPDHGPHVRPTGLRPVRPAVGQRPLPPLRRPAGAGPDPPERPGLLGGGPARRLPGHPAGPEGQLGQPQRGRRADAPGLPHPHRRRTIRWPRSCSRCGRSSSAIPPTTPGCGAWCPRRSPPRWWSRCGPGPSRWWTSCSTRPSRPGRSTCSRSSPTRCRCGSSATCSGCPWRTRTGSRCGPTRWPAASIPTSCSPMR